MRFSALSLALHHILTPLAKGELLSPEKIRATTGGIAIPPFASHYPLLSTTSLPPLSKGGGLTARHKLLSCCVLIATHLPFYSLNFSAVKTEGLLYTHQPLHPPLPLQKDNNPSKIAKCINLNSEPEKCCPINRTIGSLLS